jgi:hypothetical protein
MPLLPDAAFGRWFESLVEQFGNAPVLRVVDQDVSWSWNDLNVCRTEQAEEQYALYTRRHMSMQWH